MWRFVPIATLLQPFGVKPNIKKQPPISRRPVFSSGAEGRTRTGTYLHTADFESAASANSATSALLGCVTTSHNSAMLTYYINIVNYFRT